MDRPPIMIARFTYQEVMMRTKKPQYPVMLPATSVTKEMRQDIVRFAEETGSSIAEVQREAFTFFLSKNDSMSIMSDGRSITNERRDGGE